MVSAAVLAGDPPKAAKETKERASRVFARLIEETGKAARQPLYSVTEYHPARGKPGRKAYKPKRVVQKTLPAWVPVGVMALAVGTYLVWGLTNREVGLLSSKKAPPFWTGAQTDWYAMKDIYMVKKAERDKLRETEKQLQEQERLERIAAQKAREAGLPSPPVPGFF